MHFITSYSICSYNIVCILFYAFLHHHNGLVIHIAITFLQFCFTLVHPSVPHVYETFMSGSTFQPLHN